jgi:hypothetical protein
MNADNRALEYAVRLATALWEKHYREDAPHWKPCNNTLDVLMQIDNMTAKLVRTAESK